MSLAHDHETVHPDRQGALLRGLWIKRVQLSVSGCLGPCDVPNVVTNSNEAGTLWLGHISEFGQYQALVDWASRSKDAGKLLPLPEDFRGHTLHPFLEADSTHTLSLFR